MVSSQPGSTTTTYLLLGYNTVLGAAKRFIQELHVTQIQLCSRYQKEKAKPKKIKMRLGKKRTVLESHLDQSKSVLDDGVCAKLGWSGSICCSWSHDHLSCSNNQVVGRAVSFLV